MRQALELTYEARVLRASAAEAEAKLWPYLRNRRLDGYKIRRARPIGEVVVGFYCARRRLAIEVADDGMIQPYFRRTVASHRVALLVLPTELVLGRLDLALAQLRERLSDERLQLRLSG